MSSSLVPPVITRWALPCVLLISSSCVSSSDHQRLERRLELSLLEKENALHAQKSVERELGSTLTRVQELERQVEELAQGEQTAQKNQRDAQRTISSLSLELSAYRQVVAQLRTLVGNDTLAARPSGDKSVVALPRAALTELMTALPRAEPPPTGQGQDGEALSRHGGVATPSPSSEKAAVDAPRSAAPSADSAALGGPMPIHESDLSH